MNKVILMGRLTRDPEVRYGQGETPLCVTRYSLAVDRKWKRDGEQEADFINCVVFGKDAEFAEKYFRKGTRVLVSGRIETGSYTNRDGVKVYTTTVVVEDQEFAESKAASNGGDYPTSGSNNSTYVGGSQYTSKPAPSMATGDGFVNIPDGIEDEGLPFN